MKYAFCLLVVGLLACNSPTSSVQKVTVTAKYWPGTASSPSVAKISVGGQDFTTIAVNSSKALSVDDGASLSATWMTYIAGVATSHSDNATARQGLQWSFP